MRVMFEVRDHLSRNWARLQGALAAGPAHVRKHLPLVLGHYARHDARISHVIIGGLVVLGTMVNLFMPHGWTVWPLVVMAAMIILIHEAADRHGQGVPPLYVYALFAAALLSYFVLVLILGAVNPLLLGAGMLALTYYGGQGYLKRRERALLISKRRAAGLCIYCGAVADPQHAFCLRCGEEPDPDAALLKRVAEAPRTAQGKARTRAALTPAPPTAAMAKKEQVFLARRHRTKRPNR